MKRFLNVLVLTAVLACKDDEPEKKPLPSDLSFTVEASTDGSGEISVQATAENAAFYRIHFGDIFSETYESEDGYAEYDYYASGTYTITVQAHSTDEDFISTTQIVTIDVLVDIPDEGAFSPESYDGMELVWADEFDGPGVDETSWTFEIGNGNNGWGNNELQYYDVENTTIQDGHLIITAKNEAKGGKLYTSSRLITKGKREFQYGRVDIRAALPYGQGLWPALWMLGSNIDQVSWPACGEIDIMEMIGGQGREKTVHGTVHWDHLGQYASYGGNTSLSTGTFKDKFHVFSIVWDETTITWYLDGVQFHIIDITPDPLSEFHQPYFFIFNVAVGGNWPGNPDGGTILPQYMVVDYIRVFQPQ